MHFGSIENICRLFTAPSAIEMVVMKHFQVVADHSTFY
ncbi:hypothetical protein yinte0001_41870 [Yersinia intermedia ATCC 29909]|nr:hypothetical protein yinte0001_41870 [Yersinia intermedia ATCC 29909]